MLKALTLNKKTTALFTFLSLTMVAVFATDAHAFTVASGDMFYDVYELVIEKILGGPIGFVAGAFMLVGGIFLLVQGRGFLLPMICLIGGAVLVKVDAIVTSFGFSLDSVITALPSATQFLF